MNAVLDSTVNSIAENTGQRPAGGEWPQADARGAAPPDRPALLLLAAAAGLLLLLARPVLSVWWADYALPDSDYAYGPIVPDVALLMLWHRRRAIRDAGGAPCLSALGLLLPALGLLVLAEKRELSSLASLGLLLVTWSGAWLILGTRRVRAALFPLAFLLCMAPLPGPLIHDATYGCQQLSTVLADRTLHLLGFPTALSGNVITMDTFVLLVDTACSGMRLLLTMLVIGAALAWLADGPPWRRAALFAGAVPLSMAVNTGRIALLGVSGECFGASAEHVFHDTCGLLTVAVGVLLYLWLLRRVGCRTLAGWRLF